MIKQHSITLCLLVLVFLNYISAAPVLSLDEQILEARAGSFATISQKDKKDAEEFLDKDVKGHQIEDAMTGGTSARTVASNKNFHLDRQQPTNGEGTHKVALQFNKPVKDGISTIAQVSVPPKPEKHHPISSAEGKNLLKTSLDRNLQASNELKALHGVNIPKTHTSESIEVQAQHRPDKQAMHKQRMDDIQKAKEERIKQAQKKGDEKAAKGIYRKGKKL